jgi:hypothetical protein
MLGASSKFARRLHAVRSGCAARGWAVLHAHRGRAPLPRAVVYATFKLLQRDAKLNFLAWEWQDMVEGHLIQLTNNGDHSRTFAWVGMHAHKLYIAEGTVPSGYPEPGLFQQSIGWVDKDGNGIRYQNIYSNSFHGMGVYPVPATVVAAAVPAPPVRPRREGDRQDGRVECHGRSVKGRGRRPSRARARIRNRGAQAPRRKSSGRLIRYVVATQSAVSPAREPHDFPERRKCTIDHVVGRSQADSKIAGCVHEIAWQHEDVTIGEAIP